MLSSSIIIKNNLNFRKCDKMYNRSNAQFAGRNTIDKMLEFDTYTICDGPIKQFVDPIYGKHFVQKLDFDDSLPDMVFPIVLWDSRSTNSDTMHLVVNIYSYYTRGERGDIPILVPKKIVIDNPELENKLKLLYATDARKMEDMSVHYVDFSADNISSDSNSNIVDYGEITAYYDNSKPGSITDKIISIKHYPSYMDSNVDMHIAIKNVDDETFLYKSQQDLIREMRSRHMIPHNTNAFIDHGWLTSSHISKTGNTQLAFTNIFRRMLILEA